MINWLYFPKSTNAVVVLVALQKRIAEVVIGHELVHQGRTFIWVEVVHR